MKKLARILLVVLTIAAFALSALGTQYAQAGDKNCHSHDPNGDDNGGQDCEGGDADGGDGDDDNGGGNDEDRCDDNNGNHPCSEETNEPTDTPTDVSTDKPTATSTPSPTPIVTSTPSLEEEEEKVKEDKPAPATASCEEGCCCTQTIIFTWDEPGDETNIREGIATLNDLGFTCWSINLNAPADADWTDNAFNVILELTGARE